MMDFFTGFINAVTGPTAQKPVPYTKKYVPPFNYREAKRYYQEKFKSRRWLTNLKELYLERSEKLEWFEKFKCKPFFVGETVAANNRKHLKWGLREVDKKMNIAEKYLERLK